MAVTSHDVARRAGVSQPTVSRALRDQRGVAPATRSAVREAARALGYVPLQAGRALSTQKTRRVGVVSAEMQNPFYPALVDPLNTALAGHGYRTILVTDRDGEDIQLEQLVDGSLDGVVLTTSTVDSDLPGELARRGVPHVLLNRDVRGSRSDACLVDNAAGAAMVADLLVDHGHRRIGGIFGPRDTSTGAERANAFRRRLARRGHRVDELLVRSGPFSEHTGRLGLEDLASSAALPTAIFCGNDVIAFGVLNAARSLGIDVPGELTVVGFDDIPMSAWSVLDLTTVSVDLSTLASRAADQLVRRMAAPDDPVRSRLKVRPRLSLRGTHGSP